MSETDIEELRQTALNMQSKIETETSKWRGETKLAVSNAIENYKETNKSKND